MKKTSKRQAGAGSRRGRAASDYQIFVSHATADKWIARVICEKLEERGAATFRDDRDIQGGDDLPDTIRQEIKRSKELLVLLTPESVGRAWVLLEIGVAWGRSRNMRIVGVRCHVDMAPIPDVLKSKKIIHLNEFDQYLAEVSQRISAKGRATQ